MGDRLGIQVAVDILPFFAFFVHIMFNKLYSHLCQGALCHILHKIIQICPAEIDSAGPRTVEPLHGSRRKASITYNKMHNCAPYNFNFLPAFEHFGFITPRFFPLKLVYGHITLNTPVLVRSLKLSKVETC